MGAVPGSKDLVYTAAAPSAPTVQAPILASWFGRPSAYVPSETFGWGCVLPAKAGVRPLTLPR